MCLTRKLTVAEYQQLFALTGRDLSKKGQKVVRNALGILAHDAAGVGTARVKVSEEGTVPLLVLLASLLKVVALSVNKVCDDILNHGLGAAVGVGGPDGAMLGDGDHVGEAGGIAVDGGGGGEDDVVDVVALHGAEKSDAAADIDTVVLEGNLAGLADSLRMVLTGVTGGQQTTCLESSKVNHTVNGRVLLKDIVEGLLVGHVELVESRTAAGQQLDAVEGNLG